MCFEVESGVLYVSSDGIHKMLVFCICMGERNLAAFLGKIIIAGLMKSQTGIRYNSPW